MSIDNPLVPVAASFTTSSLRSCGLEWSLCCTLYCCIGWLHSIALKKSLWPRFHLYTGTIEDSFDQLATLPWSDDQVR